MGKYNFNTVIDRKNTNCLKYDFAVERNKPVDILPFWVADMDFQVPNEVIDELVRRSEHGVFGYTDIKQDYALVMEKWFLQQHNWQINKEALVITPGVVFALATAVRAFTNKGEAVLIQRPVYYPFSMVIEENERVLINNPLQLKDGHYEIDFVDFEQKIIDNQVKLFILCNPHNPVGRVWRKEELEQLGEICLKHNVIIVADEIHQEFVRKGEHTVFASLSKEIAAQTITCTAPSKTFNLAGLQISNIFIENKKLRTEFVQAISKAGYSQPNTLGIFATQAAYAYGQEWLTELKIYLESNYQKTKEFLAERLPEVQVIESEGTYLMWLDFRALGLTDAQINDKIVNEAGLWLDYGTMFGTEGSGFQRINIACPWATLEEGLQRLVKVFA